MSSRFRAVSSFLAFATAVLPAVLSADVVRLKNGGEVRGSVERAPGGGSQKPKEKPAEVVVRTLSGAKVAVGRSEIESIEKRPLSVEEYDRRARTVNDDVESRWTLAEWCRVRNLKPQRAEQLERIIELDPAHEKAHYGLGHSRLDGEWVNRDEVLRERGYIPYKGRYVSAEERDILEKAAANREAEIKWFKKIRLWHAWLKHADAEKNRQGMDELSRVVDSDAIAALTNFLWKDDNDQVRRLYVGILTRMPGLSPVPMLVQSSLADTSSQVRGEALDAITGERMIAALPMYIQALKNSQNEIVGRAAVALHRIGDAQAVPALIEALVTTHQYKVNVIDTSATYSFSRDGGFAPYGTPLPPEVEAGLLAGKYPNGVYLDPSYRVPPKYRVVTVRRDQKNPEVLAALETLTGERYGYDEHMWRLWWGAQKSGIPGKFNNVP